MVFSSEEGLVLASGSRYRKALLEQLRLRHTVCAADIDESPREDEPPAELATRLACQKARAVATRYPASLIIGSDQVASIDGRSAFSTPVDHAGAIAQLSAMSGRIRGIDGSALSKASRWRRTRRSSSCRTDSVST